jgi:DNA polymerase-3 subunit gamma/tau
MPKPYFQMAKKSRTTEGKTQELPSGSNAEHSLKEKNFAADSGIATSSGNGKYTVVARRYRPKTFAELVGQSTVAQALLSAINSNRVGHAYLFTGARGVGKTSTARIFAKALNASAETNGQFDPNSDMAQAIDAGEDMDVLEIDGASNRGIDEIRQLRANAAVRPSRSRYKIYIIDEVHMLTPQAFNALLKTLEEPPGHVKFIFCTTDPEKLPITVLSRCQRFDFPPVHTEQIYERLKFICQNEGTNADEAALRLIARRAAGSMRDSQSLLEQLLSFGGDRITADVVHAMLGTADETRLSAFASRLIARDAAGALRELDNAASEGVDVGQLAEQLLGYLRDMMTVSVGGGADLIRTANTNSADQLIEWGKSWGTMTLLSALQLLDETIVKMRHSVQSRVLLEVALVQICNLQDLQSLSELVKAFAAGQQAPVRRVATPTGARVAVPAEEAKKKDDLDESATNANSTAVESVEDTEHVDALVESNETATAIADPIPKAMPLTMAAKAAKDSKDSNAEEFPTEPGQAVDESDTEPELSNQDVATVDPLLQFRECAIKLGGFAEQCAAMAVRIEAVSDSQWRVCLSRDGAMVRDYFVEGENGKRLKQAVKQMVGRDIHLSFALTDEPSSVAPAQEADVTQPNLEERPVETVSRTVSQAQLIRNAMSNPLVKQFMDVFEGQIMRVDPVRIQVPAVHFQIMEPPIVNAHENDALPSS